jgi:membrane fusion protein (multidrug efflux system)
MSPATAEKPAAVESPPARPTPRGKRRVLIAVAALMGSGLLGAALGFWLYWRHFEETDDAFIDGHVVPVSARISGHLARVLIDDNKDVKAGELLVTIDPRDYEARVEEMHALLASNEAKLAQAQAGLERSHADVSAAEAEEVASGAEAERAEIDAVRYESAPHAVTQQQIDNARAARKSTRAQLVAARERISAARAQVPQAEAVVKAATADVANARAQLAYAELQLSYSQIEAPMTGRVTRKAAEPGQYVQPGEQLCAVVQPDVWVIANFRETQLRHMQPGQRVTIQVDAYPDRDLEGHVDSIQKGSGARFSLLPPENATGNYVKVVQRVPVKIVFDEDLATLGRLGVGMSVVPKVRVR